MITPTDAQWAAVQAIVAWYKARAIGRGPQVFYLAGYAGTGKPGTLDSLLQTPRGPMRMGDIAVGDEVFAVDGRPTRVVAVDPQGVQPTYRVTLRDGFSTECGYGHLWTVGYMAHGHRKWETLELREIVERGLTNSAGMRYRVPLCEPLAYPDVELPLDPWFLGYVIGEGYFGRRPQVSISVSDKEAAEVIPRLMASATLRGGDAGAGCRSWRVHDETNAAFRALGFTTDHRSADMFIPALYRYAGVADRWALLRGLMDAEGSSSGNRISFSTTSPILAEHVAEIVQSLGGVAVIRQAIRKRTAKVEYTVNVKVAECPFTLAAKAKNWSYSWKNPPSRCIRSVERVEDKPQQCIQVDHPSGLYLADACIVTHNSTIFGLALRELQRWGCKSHALATFTGKAASVLRKKGNPEAQTIHSLIYRPPEDDEDVPPSAGAELKFTLAWDGPAAEVDLIALDEVSMVNQEMGQDVLSFGKPVLVMGDPGQLPPVRGTGFFFDREPDAFLDEVHRQAAGSPIIRLATLAREGRPLELCDWDEGALGHARVLDLTRETQKLVYREDTQALCGKHSVRKAYTARIRHRRGFGGTLPMAGEPIMCGKNNRERLIFNGMPGRLLSEPRPYRRKAGDDAALSDLLEFDVQMDDQRHPLTDVLVHPHLFYAHFGDVEPPRMRKNIEWFDWAYLFTVHKFQGSEAPDVTVVDDSGVFGDDKHRHRYTAITRASERLTFLRR